MKLQFLFFILLLTLSLSAQTQITTDGTLGSALNLPGPDYHIGADLGQQHGSNLFHSFQKFNIQQFESATFSGPESVNMILSRVTGGQPSHINGLIRSTIPNAEFLFLNPAGIIFGEHARLDVQSGFHASTADYLRLGKSGRFDARSPEQSILTVAPASAFGFLEAPTGIQIEGSQLSIVSKTDFSLIGGNLSLNRTELLASSGRFNLVSVASKGEVTAKKGRYDMRIPDTSSFAKLGYIEMTDSHVETSGDPAGGISIHAGQFAMDNSFIHGHTLGDREGKDIDILARDWLHIQGKSAEISDHEHTVHEIDDNDENFGIISNTFGRAKAGDIVITTPRLEMTQSAIDTSTKSEGEGGNIKIQSQQIHLGEGASIYSNSYDAGAGGQINIKATEQIELVDQRIFMTEQEAKNQPKTSIKTNALGRGKGGLITIETPDLKLSGGYILSNTDNQGDGGTVIINADFVELLNGSLISTGILFQGTGKGGQTQLNVSDTITISGFRPGFLGEREFILTNVPSSLGTTTFGKGQGNLLEISAKNLVVTDYGSLASASLSNGQAGDMKITVDNLYLKGGGILSSSSGGIMKDKLLLSTGNGGNLTVIAKEDIIIEGSNPFYSSNISSQTFLSGHSGNINIEANRLILNEGGTVSAKSFETGNAGNIHIKANQIILGQDGKITSSAAQAVGGHISISTPVLLQLQDSQISTTVYGGKGDGGNLNIDNATFVVMDNSQIVAQADGGKGGNINIDSKQLISSPNSLISASSRLGLDGQVQIDSPAIDLDAMLVVLPGGYVEAQLKQCSQKEIDNPSRFKINLNRSIPIPFGKP